MTQIKAIAHVNNLTKDDSTDYYLIPQILATLGPDGIIERLRKREIATKNVDGKSFVETFLEECSVASAEGYNIVTSFFKSSIGLQGVVYAEDLGHPIAANRLKVLVNLTQGEGAKKAIEGTSIFAYEQTGAVGPIIQAVMDPTEMVASHLNPGSMVLIQGMRLALKGDIESVGILFTNADDSSKTVFITPAKVYPNTSTKLQFVLPPEVTEGTWFITVTTQASGNSTILTKEPRSYQFNTILKVGNAGSGGDDRPEIE